MVRRSSLGNHLSMPLQLTSSQVASPREVYLHHARVQISELIGLVNRWPYLMQSSQHPAMYMDHLHKLHVTLREIHEAQRCKN